jgi:hypothetical protein
MNDGRRMRLEFGIIAICVVIPAGFITAITVIDFLAG